MVPSESTPQELSNEWSCQYVSTIVNFGAIYVFYSVVAKRKFYKVPEKESIMIINILMILSITFSQISRNGLTSYN
jgi:hypothetical protein